MQLEKGWGRGLELQWTRQAQWFLRPRHYPLPLHPRPTIQPGLSDCLPVKRREKDGVLGNLGFSVLQSPRPG